MSERIGGLVLDVTERIKELEADNKRLRELLRETKKFVPVSYPTQEEPNPNSLRDLIIDALKEATP